MSGERHGLGVISDTHGLLRPEAVEALRGSEMIVHAGDIGSPEVLRGLEAIAPVIAVRGNNDREPWAKDLPLTDSFELAGASIYVLHDLPISVGHIVIEGWRVRGSLRTLEIAP